MDAQDGLDITYDKFFQIVGTEMKEKVKKKVLHIKSRLSNKRRRITNGGRRT